MTEFLDSKTDISNTEEDSDSSSCESINDLTENKENLLNKHTSEEIGSNYLSENSQIKRYYSKNSFTKSKQRGKGEMDMNTNKPNSKAKRKHCKNASISSKIESKLI